MAAIVPLEVEVVSGNLMEGMGVDAERAEEAAAVVAEAVGEAAAVAEAEEEAVGAAEAEAVAEEEEAMAEERSSTRVARDQLEEVDSF